MPADIRQPFEDFAYMVLDEYRKTLPEGKLSPAIWKEQIGRAHKAWTQYRKPKRKPPIADESAWVESIKSDPLMVGIDVGKEIAKCQFHWRNQSPPIVCTRRHIINWLKKADRAVTSAPVSRVVGLPKPDGFEKWFEETREAAAPKWESLDRYAQQFLIKDMNNQQQRSA